MNPAMHIYELPHYSVGNDDFSQIYNDYLMLVDDLESLNEHIDSFLWLWERYIPIIVEKLSSINNDPSIKDEDRPKMYDSLYSFMNANIRIVLKDFSDLNLSNLFYAIRNKKRYEPKDNSIETNLICSILLPPIVVHASIIRSKFKVPFYCAIHQGFCNEPSHEYCF